ncbi:intramembrane serine protease GlpG [Stieleria varia]|uniref:Intramembrane serine protease GlpG n=2 Tax=Stieleria varia TaxID=2528005 RepID=A0A5C5ZVA3_9BACT|nr:intramembrane serine protease GlpG [Stieleria varia]
MGLYERDYGRDDALTPWEQYEREQRRMQPKSVVIILLVVTVAIHLLDMLFQEKVDISGQVVSVSRFAQWFAVRRDTVIEPWTWYQFLTYGFIHDQRNIFHIAFNMLGLFVFGRPVEQKIGRGEFLRFYLVSMFIGGVLGSLTYWVTGKVDGGVIGASGAVLATTILFACHYPHEKVLLMMVFPIKAWIIAVIFVAGDLLGTLTMLSEASSGIQSRGGTAFTVHLAGAAFGALYFYQRWNLEFLDVTRFRDNVKTSARRTKLKVHDPDKKLRQEEAEADRILAKIHESGEASLTSKERRTLQRYSKRKREGRD